MAAWVSPAVRLEVKQSYLICELIPKRACSSGTKRCGRMAADRSFCMPACFPRRNEAMLPGCKGSVGKVQLGSSRHQIRRLQVWRIWTVEGGIAIYHAGPGGEGSESGLRI